MELDEKQRAIEAAAKANHVFCDLLLNQDYETIAWLDSYFRRLSYGGTLTRERFEEARGAAQRLQSKVLPSRARDEVTLN